MENRAILVVSFGTSHPDALKNCIETTENAIFSTLPDFEHRRAFTSQFIIRKLAKRDGVFIDNPQEALERLKNEGFRSVVVQPLHILPGYEYHEIFDAVMKERERKTFKSLQLGEPLIYNNEDYDEIVEGMKAQLTMEDSGTTCILMGHGTNHFSNACYYCLQSHMLEAGLNAYIANVEGDPSLECLIQKLKQKDIRKVLLMPFMLVAGDHAKNDMAGERESWKTLLEDEGFGVEVCLRGLGENERLREIFAKKALKAEAAINCNI